MLRPTSRVRIKQETFSTVEKPKPYCGSTKGLKTIFARGEKCRCRSLSTVRIPIPPASS